MQKQIMETLRIASLLLWILISNIGVTHANNVFKHITVNEGLAHTDANCVVQDSTGLIWIGTNAGLQKFNGYQLQTIDYYPIDQKIYKAHNRINAMECSKDYLWIGSDSGLTCLDLRTHRYVPCTVIANDSSLLKERIHQIAIDNINQRLWIRTENRLCIAEIVKNNTLRVLNWENDNDRNISWSYSKPAIYKGYAWTLTNNYLVQMEFNDKIRVKNSYNLSDILQNSGFCALFITNDFLYLRFSQGCCKMKLKNGIPDTKHISNVIFHEINPNIPKQTNGCFIVDSNETLWCSYFGGIFKVDNPFTQGTNIRNYLSTNKDVNFSLGTINSLFIDTYNNLWIPMASRGVYYRSLLPSPFHSILDEKQNVWIGGNGISCFNPETGKISIYELADGLQTNSLKIGVGSKSSDGTIYMGGIGGGNYFRPQDIANISHPVTLSFCDLYVNNKLIIPQTEYEGRITLSTILDETKKLELTHNQNNFIISFSALGYNLSNRIMYRYKMDGYDKTWQISPYSLNNAHYSNLPHGQYKFRLQISTNRGYSWVNSEKSINISILPPWWLTGWAKTAYIIVFTLIITTFGYQYHREQKLKREKHIQEILRANEEEKHQSKMRFFMNISHELKTPLTLIMLAAERMAELNLSKECMTILSNSRRMLSLITELIDLRKTDLGINELSLSFNNISELVEQLYTEMIPWAEKKNITISFIPAEKDLKMEIDQEKIGKLIINLISNAIKYTPSQGKIELSLKQGMMSDISPMYSVQHKEGEIPEKSPICIFTIRDTGIGISSESIGSIYDRFFQVKDTKLTHLGSGIGLAIAKNMVLLHKGCIIVSSERNVGTEFIVALPITNETLSKEKTSTDISSFNTKEFIEKQYIEYVPSESANDNSISKQSPNKELPTLLIVEDNKELQTALTEQLSLFYNIKVADNGKIGLEMCETLYPDIIISDVMMPEMDGIEMCKKIRENLSIAYIPIILLTAKGNIDNQIEGYESGADLYIPKPFSAKFLEVNIRRLLQQKERWLKAEQQPFKEKEYICENPNQYFAERLRKLIEENIGDPNFSIDFLCQELGLGRTKLYAKMKEISEQPLADYIRNIRLEKAAYLLKHSELNVNEVLLETGFVNNSHFSKIFKLKYGVTPTEYKKIQ